MNTLFNIPPKHDVGTNHTLLLEVGAAHCSYAYFNKESKTVDGLYYHSLGEAEAESELSTLLTDVTKTGVQSAVLCSAFPQALLVPAKFFSRDYALLDVIYGQRSSSHFHDSIPEWQLVNIYSFPQALREAVDASFFSVEFYHAYTPAIKIYSGYVADNQLLVHFNPGDFRVLLKKDTAIGLAQTYAYKTPLDVLYYLLKICYEFELSPQSIHLIVSGLIDKDSALYVELQQYFLHLHFTHPPQMAFATEGQPHHFFTSLFNLASCVS